MTLNSGLCLLKYVRYLAPRCLEGRMREKRRFMPHRCLLMVKQDGTRRYRPGWYGAFQIYTFTRLTPFTTGFNYKFDALSSGPKKNELDQAFRTAFRAGTRAHFRAIAMIRGMVPALRFLVSRICYQHTG